MPGPKVVLEESIAMTVCVSAASPRVNSMSAIIGSKLRTVVLQRSTTSTLKVIVAVTEGKFCKVA